MKLCDRRSKATLTSRRHGLWNYRVWERSVVSNTRCGTENVTQMNPWSHYHQMALGVPSAAPNPVCSRLIQNCALISPPHTFKRLWLTYATGRRAVMWNQLFLAVVMVHFCQSCRIRVSGDDCNNFQIHATQLIWGLWILNAQFSVRKQLSLACIPPANSNTSYSPHVDWRDFLLVVMEYFKKLIL